MKKNRWWHIPLSAIGYFVFMYINFYVLGFVEYLLFEDVWGGNIIDVFIMLFNIVFCFICSILFVCIVLPSIIDKGKIGKKTAFILVKLLFIIICIAECFLICFDGNSDIYYFLYQPICFYLAPITEYVLYYTNRFAACICVVIFNSAVLFSFYYAIKKHNKVQ